jgi:Kae1-associated kinase Bud32
MVSLGSPIAEGAEAKVYNVKLMGIDAVIKRRESKPYRERQLDLQLRSDRTKSEARITGMASSLGVNAPSVLLVDTYDIYMSRVNGIGMGRLIGGSGVKARLLETVGIYLGLLHNAGIAHGDYTPANIMVGPSGAPSVIDFGLSEITHSTESKAIDLLLMKRSLSARQYASFAAGYRRSCREAAAVLARLKEIETRGRYKTRTLVAKG